MANYVQHVSARHTPQTEPIHGKPMVQNDAGGYSFAVDDWTRLDRFLIFGSEKGTYYASERKLTKDAAGAVQRCLDADASRAVARIVSVSESGRAPKNDPAIFALALAAAHKTGAPLALAALSKVCRVGTHLFQFVAAVNELRGWGRALRNGVAAWYTEKDAKALSYQILKYQQRDGWSHRDVLRLSHPQAVGSTQDVLHYAVKGWDAIGSDPHPDAALVQLWAFERLKREPSVKLACNLIRAHKMTREMVPTQLLTESAVWDALLDEMPLTALIRNLATMTKIGLIAPMSAGVGRVLSHLADGERLKRSRVHPVQLLLALLTYRQGHGERGKATWNPVPQICDALDVAFYLAFGNVEPTGKRWLIGLDVSGSMRGTRCVGSDMLTCHQAQAAVSLITAATEQQHAFVAFDTSAYLPAISPRQRLDDVVGAVSRLGGGGTDCSLPILWALQTKTPVDVFAIFTDSQTWQGRVHPTQALTEYRQRMGIPAKLAVVAMCANDVSIADPSDAGQMDAAGFDASLPQVVADFAR